jgi:hypothetical protein
VKLPPNPTNVNRMEQLQLCKPPKYRPGQKIVEPYGEAGVIDVVYADLEAAIDAFVIKEGWYETQEKKPKTPKSGIFYGVVISYGACLVGEDDLKELPS